MLLVWQSGTFLLLSGTQEEKHVLKLEEKRKLAQVGRETQQELIFYLLKFNRDISALD